MQELVNKWRGGALIDTLTAAFRRHGYALIESFAPEHECQDILRAIDAYRRMNSLIDVDRASITVTAKFLTFNGEDVVQNVPSASRFYTQVNEVVNSLSGRHYNPLDNIKIGLSINITPAGGTFSWHYDRNEIMAILYLNEVEGGGQLEFYPKYRLIMKNSHYGLKK
jgi:hypothetical protein